MASRRMFSKKIISSTRFIKMPPTTQLLYFHLCLNADDDGVVEAYSVMRVLNCTEDDLKILISKQFAVVLNEDLVTYITDWQEHNNIRADRKVDSMYKDLLLKITSIGQPNVNQLTDKCQTNDGQMSAECPHRLGKDRLGKDRLGKDREEESMRGEKQTSTSSPSAPLEDIKEIFNYWQEVMNKTRSKLDDKRKKKIQLALKSYSLVDIKLAIDGCKKSDFHMGNNKDNMVYNDIELILRDNKHIEMFIEMNSTTRNKKNSYDLSTEDYSKASEYFPEIEFDVEPDPEKGIF